MVETGLVWLIVSFGLFVILLLVVRAEQKRGQRFLLPGLRGWFDRASSAVGLRITQLWDHFTKYVLQLGWYYGLHSVLRTVLKTIIAFYEKIEHVFENNHRRAKQLRAEKKQKQVSTNNHLTEMAQHKVDTALTSAQQRKLKDKQLKGD